MLVNVPESTPTNLQRQPSCTFYAPITPDLTYELNESDVRIPGEGTTRPALTTAHVVHVSSLPETTKPAGPQQGLWRAATAQ